MRLRALALAFVALPAIAQEDDPELLFRAERNPIRAVFQMAYRTSLAVDQANVALGQANASLEAVVAGIADVSEKVDTLVEPPAGPISRCAEPPQGVLISSSAILTVCQGGTCQEISQPCFPYACNPLLNTCNSRCSSSRDCHAGAVCDARVMQCAPVGYTCGDSYSVTSASGSTAGCMGYRCIGGACQSTCGNDLDCNDGEGYRCVQGRCVR